MGNHHVFSERVQKGVIFCDPDADLRVVTVLRMMLSSLYIYTMLYFSSTVKLLHLFFFPYRSVSQHALYLLARDKTLENECTPYPQCDIVLCV